MNSCELVTFVSSVACALSQNCSKDELAILPAVFQLLGEALDTILVHEEVCAKEDG